MAHSRENMEATELTTIEQALLNDYQQSFPLSPAPFEDIADELGTTAAIVLKSLETLTEKGLISRVGPVIRPNSIGASTLAAMAVPPERIDEIAELVSSYRAVNHNYERDHRFNLWFVVAAPDRKTVESIIGDIETRAELEVIRLPMLRDFHIDLGFELGGSLAG